MCVPGASAPRARVSGPRSWSPYAHTRSSFELIVRGPQIRDDTYAKNVCHGQVRRVARGRRCARPGTIRGRCASPPPLSPAPSRCERPRPARAPPRVSSTRALSEPIPAPTRTHSGGPSRHASGTTPSLPGRTRPSWRRWPRTRRAGSWRESVSSTRAAPSTAPATCTPTAIAATCWEPAPSPSRSRSTRTS